MHIFVSTIGSPLHVVAHDFGAWVAYSWALLLKDDFKSLTLIDAGIPGVTLTEDIQLSDFKRKWNFIFQMLPDLLAALTAGKEDLYVGWWFDNKVYRPGAIPADDVAWDHTHARAKKKDWHRRRCPGDPLHSPDVRRWSGVRPRFWGESLSAFYPKNHQREK